jgi:2-dehydropantoate 2-reductase
MKIAMMGSGGVGGYFGARLAAAGCDVAFIARGRHLEAIRREGLRVESPLGDAHVHPARATDDPASIGPVDLVIFSVKLWDTAAAAAAIRPLVGPETGVLSLQNGVQKDDVLRGVLGDAPVMGGVCYIATLIERPGVIKHTGKMQRLVFGEYDGRRSGRAEALLAAAQRGGVDAELATDIRRAIWEKFVFLVGMSGATATIRLPIGPIRANKLTRQFHLDLMREVVAVGRAHGVGLPADFAEQRLGFADTLPPEMTASMHHDLERGNRLEVMWLAGGVVALGEQVGVPTPLNRAVRDILALHAEGKPAG